MSMYKIVRWATYATVKLMFPFRIVNKKQALQTPCVIVANHLSNCDAFIVGAAFKKKVYALTKKESFTSKAKSWFLRTLGGIPIDRDNPDPGTIINCVRLLKGGDSIIIFPEGTRNTTDQKLLPFKSGAALFAVKAKVPIQPIFIDGKSRFLKRNHVIVGEAFTLEEYYGKRLNEDMLKQIDEQIKNSLLKTAELPVK